MQVLRLQRSHTLSWLTVAQALVASRQRPESHLQKILQCTRGIIFLGTPHHGSGLARWAEMLAKSIGFLKQTNPKILQVLQNDSEVLARIQDSFHAMVRARNQDRMQPIEITCFFEELPLPGIGDVSNLVPRVARIICRRVFWHYSSKMRLVNIIMLLGSSSALSYPTRLHTNRDPQQPYGYDKV
jgi:hypothetical protein